MQVLFGCQEIQENIKRKLIHLKEEKIQPSHPQQKITSTQFPYLHFLSKQTQKKQINQCEQTYQRKKEVRKKNYSNRFQNAKKKERFSV